MRNKSKRVSATNHGPPSVRRYSQSAVDHFLNIVLSLDPHAVVVLLSIDNQENVSKLSSPDIYWPGLFKNAPEQRSRFEVWMTLCKCCSAGVYFDAE